MAPPFLPSTNDFLRASAELLIETPENRHNMGKKKNPKRQNRADNALVQPATSLVELRVLTRDEAMSSAGTLVDQLLHRDFDQASLLARVKAWLDVNVYIVLPLEFKYKVSCYCLCFWPGFLKRLPSDAEDNKTETRYNALVQESAPKILTKQVINEMIRDMIFLSNKITVPSRGNRLFMRRSLGLVASKIRWQEKKIDELVEALSNKGLDDLSPSADPRINVTPQKRAADNDELGRGSGNKRQRQGGNGTYPIVEKGGNASEGGKSRSPRVTRSQTRNQSSPSFERLSDEQCEQLDAWDKAHCDVDSH